MRAATLRRSPMGASRPTATADPQMRALARVLPEATDREGWHLISTSRAADTGVPVHHYVFRHTARVLRLDDRGRVYGEDREGVVRLFGRGGPLALHIALKMIFDGCEDRRP